MTGSLRIYGVGAGADLVACNLRSLLHFARLRG